MNHTGLHKVVKSVRGRKGSVQRSYWVKNAPAAAAAHHPASGVPRRTGGILRSEHVEKGMSVVKQGATLALSGAVSSMGGMIASHMMHTQRAHQLVAQAAGMDKSHARAIMAHGVHAARDAAHSSASRAAGQIAHASHDTGRLLHAAMQHVGSAAHNFAQHHPVHDFGSMMHHGG